MKIERHRRNSDNASGVAGKPAGDALWLSAARPQSYNIDVSVQICGILLVSTDLPLYRSRQQLVLKSASPFCLASLKS
jgi:hypothetical protein